MSIKTDSKKTEAEAEVCKILKELVQTNGVTKDATSETATTVVSSQQSNVSSTSNDVKKSDDKSTTKDNAPDESDYDGDDQVENEACDMIAAIAMMEPMEDAIRAKIIPRLTTARRYRAFVEAIPWESYTAKLHSFVLDIGMSLMKIVDTNPRRLKIG